MSSARHQYSPFRRDQSPESEMADSVWPLATSRRSSP
jgi:hypothetical protein